MIVCMYKTLVEMQIPEKDLYRCFVLYLYFVNSVFKGERSTTGCDLYPKLGARKTRHNRMPISS